MNSPFCDKYFSKTKLVAETARLNPIVKYRVFTRFAGIAALEPMAKVVMKMSEKSSVQILATGTEFEPGDTVAIITGPIQDIVELETQWLQWTALPCYCAAEAKKIMERAGDKIVLDFAARHLYDPVSVALASYGAQVGGIEGASTDVGANAEMYLDRVITEYKNVVEYSDKRIYKQAGIGTTPHALIALFGGDYLAMAEAYTKTFPEEKFVALIDYNNREIDDSLLLLEKLGKHLAGVRIDTCGENFAQVGYEQNGDPKFADEKGVSISACRALKNALKSHGGEHVKIFVSSGFNADKTGKFMEMCPSSIDGIGTGSFIPKGPTATADIFEVDGKNESKVGREWGLEKNKEFYEKETMTYVVGE